jgi:hypothetical protein
LWLPGLRKAAATTRPKVNASKSATYIAILVLILLIPSAFLWFNPQWNSLLKTLPIINTTSYPFRWIVIWIPVACIAGAMAWQAAENATRNSRLRLAGLAVFCLAMLIESGMTNREYYKDPGMQNYDPQWVNDAWVNGKQGNIPPITGLVADRSFSQNRNDYMVIGKSFIQCYNPAYGYLLETLPIGRLRPGRLALEEQDGFLNIKKPACLIWPEENGCTTVGEEYRVQEREQAQLFLQRRPIEFEVSTGQRIANGINVLALLVMVAGFLVFAATHIRQLLLFIKR